MIRISQTNLFETDDPASIDAYPISLDEIRASVARKKTRRPNQSSGQSFLFDDLEPLDNVKEISNSFGEKIIRVDGEIPVDLPLEDGQRFLFISYDQSILTHGLHKYPAKFFPELPRWLIQKYSRKNNWILDPFSGSGTTNIEAMLNHRHSVGIDVDPFARFLSKVKTTPLNPDELLDAQKKILRCVINYFPTKVKQSDMPEFPYRDNWFNREIIFELAYIRKSIRNLNADNTVKNFFLICFSSVIRAVSNADDNCTRTVIRKKLNKKVLPSDALKRFARAVLINTPRMIEFSKKCDVQNTVEFPDAMDARTSTYQSGFFDLALTSPPYANAVDYPRAHQLEMYWLDLANGSLAELKKQHVGTEAVSSEDYRHLHQTEVREADDVLKRIFTKDPRRAFIAYKYLMDMKKNMEEVFRVLKKSGRYVIVVGNNRIRGEIFESWKYLMELAKQIGFETEVFFGSEIINHFIKVPRSERIDTDWIIVLRK